MVESSLIEVYAFSVNDKYGSNGVAGLCIINLTNHSAEIDSFLLSCRIIGRNLEYAIIDYIIYGLKKSKVKSLTAKYLRTIKNNQVAQFFDILKFEIINQDHSSKDYFLSINNYVQNKINYIKVSENE
jgi:predicted enzyme involved in methoxymalonyl-ACP biosynthesis